MKQAAVAAPVTAAVFGLGECAAPSSTVQPPTISTANYPGKVLVLNIWGSWCAPCRKEAPDLAAASKTTSKSAQLIGLDIHDPDRAPAQAFTWAMKTWSHPGP